MAASLRDIANHFRGWADAAEKADNDWSDAYPAWDQVFAAVAATLRQDTIAAEELAALCVFLALDHESEHILDMVADAPAHTLAVARLAAESPDQDARWQAAVLFGRYGGSEAARGLKVLTSDSAEYVRRRALLELTDVDPAYAELTALSWLDHHEEYARLVSLRVLRKLGSPHRARAESVLRNDHSAVVRQAVRDPAV